MADIVDVINLTGFDFSISDLPIGEQLPAGSTREFTLQNTADDVQGSDQLQSLWNNGEVTIKLNGVAITGYPFLSSWGPVIFDASTTVKGITKLSVAPVLATNPIAVGDNDPRLSGLATPVDNETPAGTIDGFNDTFTLAFTPIAGSQHLYKNGIRQKPGAGNDYTISGSTITFEPGNIPIVLDTLIADYRK